MSKNGNKIIFYLAFSLLCWYLLTFSLYPSISTIINSLLNNHSLTLEYYKQFFLGKYTSVSFINTFILSITTVLVCGFVGITLSLSIHAVRVPFRKLWHIVVMMPMVIPGTVVVVAYVFLYGNRSFIGMPLREFFKVPLTAYPMEGFWGIIFIHAFTQYIFFYLLTTEAIERINTSEIEAAKSMGAGGVKIFFDIVLPSFCPHLSSAAILTFISASGSFSAPIIIGGGYRVMSTEIFFNKQAGYINLAQAEAVLLSIMIVFIVLLVRFFETKTFHGADIKGNPKPFIPVQNKTLQFICTMYLTLISIIIMLPILAVMLISFGKEGTWLNVFHSQYTFENYIKVFKSARNMAPIYNSIAVASIATVGSTIIGIFGSYVIVRTKLKGRILLESVCMLPWLLPPATILIALISAYNIPNILTFNISFIGTYFFMPLAFMILRLPVIVRSATASLITLPYSLEEASRSLGAGGLKTFIKIVLPNIITGISFSVIITFIFIMGDYAVPTFAAVAKNRPITIAILGAIQTHRIELGMVYGSCLILVAVIAMFLFSIFTMNKDKKVKN